MEATIKESQVVPHTVAEPQTWIPEFCERQGSKSRLALIPYAADILLMVRMEGYRATAQFFSQKMGKKFSTTPIVDIVKKIEAGVLVVTREQIIEIAQSHPRSAKFLQTCPEAADPQPNKTAIPEQPPMPKAKATPHKSKKSPTKSKAIKPAQAEPTPSTPNLPQPVLTHEEELERIRERGRAYKRDYDNEPVSEATLIAELQEAPRPE